MSPWRGRLPLRDAEGPDRFELFVVCSVATIAVTRIYLEITGYPQIGTGGLHIAHLLWGGLAMLASVLVFMLFLSRASKSIATVLAGVGWGLFIDEVGKFITRDNNYFFEPVAAIIYVSFVSMILLVRLAVNRTPLTDDERVVNAIELLKETAVNDLDQAERDRAFDLLAGVAEKHPVGGPLRQTLATVAVTPVAVTWASRVRAAVRRVLGRVGAITWLDRGAAVVFVAFTVTSALEAIGTFALDPSVGNSVYVVAAVLALWLAGYASWVGVRGRRRRALDLFDASLLLNLLVVQVFRLLDDQFLGYLAVLANVTLLFACQALQRLPRFAEDAEDAEDLASQS